MYVRPSSIFVPPSPFWPNPGGRPCRAIRELDDSEDCRPEDGRRCRTAQARRDSRSSQAATPPRRRRCRRDCPLPASGLDPALGGLCAFDLLIDKRQVSVLGSPPHKDKI